VIDAAEFAGRRSRDKLPGMRRDIGSATKRVAAVTIGSVILLGPGLHGAAGATTEPPGESGETATTVHPDQPAAEAALLTIDDFPVGWTEQPDAERTPLAIESQRRIAECAGGEGDRLLDLGGALAESGNFTGPDDQIVEESVAVVDEGIAEDMVARFTAPGVADCFAEAMQQMLDAMITSPSDPTETFPAGTALGEVTVVPLAVPAAGDESAGYRITVPLESRGFSFELFLDAVVIRSGGALAGLSFQSALDPFPAADIDRYVELAAARLPA
jgi:hypothetical protein